MLSVLRVGDVLPLTHTGNMGTFIVAEFPLFFLCTLSPAVYHTVIWKSENSVLHCNRDRQQCSTVRYLTMMYRYRKTEALWPFSHRAAITPHCRGRDTEPFPQREPLRQQNHQHRTIFREIQLENTCTSRYSDCVTNVRFKGQILAQLWQQRNVQHCNFCNQ